MCRPQYNSEFPSTIDVCDNKLKIQNLLRQMIPNTRCILTTHCPILSLILLLYSPFASVSEGFFFNKRRLDWLIDWLTTVHSFIQAFIQHPIKNSTQRRFQPQYSIHMTAILSKLLPQVYNSYSVIWSLTLLLNSEIIYIYNLRLTLIAI